MNKTGGRDRPRRRGGSGTPLLVLATGAGLVSLLLAATSARAGDEGAGYSMPFLERSLNKTVIHQGTRSQTIGVGRGTRHVYLPDRRDRGKAHRDRPGRFGEAGERSPSAR